MSILAAVGAFLGKAAVSKTTGIILTEIRQARMDRLNAQNNEDRIRADVRIKELEAELSERRQKLADPILKLPLFVAEAAVALYIIAIMVDSAFPSPWINPLELPEWFKPHFYLIVASIFGISAAERYLKKK